MSDIGEVTEGFNYIVYKAARLDTLTADYRARKGEISRAEGILEVVKIEMRKNKMLEGNRKV